jgi:hypothetical protein
MAKAGWPAGKPHTTETKAKIAEANRGKKRSEETKRRIKAGMRRYFLQMPADELEDTAA